MNSPKTLFVPPTIRIRTIFDTFDLVCINCGSRMAHGASEQTARGGGADPERLPRPLQGVSRIVPGLLRNFRRCGEAVDHGWSPVPVSVG